MTTTQEILSEKHLKFAWKTLRELSIGQTLDIATVAPNKPKLFVQAVMYFIDAGFWNYQFSSGYTSVKKVCDPTEVFSGDRNGKHPITDKYLENREMMFGKLIELTKITNEMYA